MDFQRCAECRALNEPRALFCSRCGASLVGPAPRGGKRRRRRVTGAGAAMGFAMLLILAAAIFLLAVVINRALSPTEEVDVFAGQVASTATITTATIESPKTSTTAASGATTATGAGNDTSSTEAAVLIRPTAARASSTLKASSMNNYGVTNLLDGDLTTAWSEGADGYGIGEWVQFDFSDKVTLTRIEIANGYQKDDERYQGNPRVKELKVEYSDGTGQLVDLLDSKDFQTIVPPDDPVTWVKMAIVSVYPGDQWDDTSLSEVRLYQAAQ